VQSSTRSLFIGIPVLAAIFAVALTPWGIRLFIAILAVGFFLAIASDIGDLLRGRGAPDGRY